VSAGQLVHAAGPVSVLYWPARHTTHVAPSLPVYPALQRQSTSSSLPVPFVYAFEGQEVQVASVFADAVEYVPLEQSEHACGPMLVLYCPGIHATHVPSISVYPTLHTHAASAVLPIGETIFAGHAVHTALLVAVLYVSTAHCVHVPPFGPVYPATHAQAVIVVLVLGEYELPGHPVHEPWPIMFVYVVVGQEVHGPPSSPKNPTLHLQSVKLSDELFDCELEAQARH
jgi:hypothetical protein